MPREWATSATDERKARSLKKCERQQDSSLGSAAQQVATAGTHSRYPGRYDVREDEMIHARLCSSWVDQHRRENQLLQYSMHIIPDASLRSLRRSHSGRSSISRSITSGCLRLTSFLIRFSTLG